MSTQDNLNNANELGRTIAALVSQPDIHLNANNTKVVDNLVAALAAKAHELLNPPAQKAISSSDVVVGYGDEVRIHGNGDVEINGNVTATGQLVDGAHNAPVSMSVAEIMAGADAAVRDFGGAAFPQTMTGPIPIYNEALTDYLRKEFKEGKIDHVVRVVSDSMGNADFYIRPLNADGETVQFVARIL